MKIIPSKYAPLWAVAKSNLSGWYVLLALLFLSLFMSGCEKGEEITECWEPQVNCSVEVSAERIMCGYGAFNNVWLKTADGAYLQPWYNLTEQKELVPGQKYKIAFKTVERDDKYKDVFYCLAAVPVSEAIVLTCISPAISNN
ncbi:hypothetical protein [Pontibacter cellulosilyticus]|uniref:DUF4377 domain-containing protein n=1 Tax=Pontibacter cellulosilyticus TaxID=1720253 RepID=A0A923SIL3_9BACT|nr:hypothetical protein [Pontibacter cellulosilyticus]MBC5992873.1 hypothetical protein [Pontibacter cellulosilyticus]